MMLLEKEFWNTCTKLGLEDHELDLAEIVWSNCEKQMLGVREQKVPSILTAKNKKVQIKKQKVKSLNNSQLQYMISNNKEIISYNEHMLRYLNLAITDLYSRCDPDNESTFEKFNAMNAMRDRARILKANIYKLSSIQKNLKDMLRSK